jgi:hypothetical protein
MLFFAVASLRLGTFFATCFAGGVAKAEEKDSVSAFCFNAALG